MGRKNCKERKEVLDARGGEADRVIIPVTLQFVLSSLSASDLKIQNAIVCVVPGQMVILKVYMQDDSAGSFIIYYIPCTHEEDP